MNAAKAAWIAALKAAALPLLAVGGFVLALISLDYVLLRGLELGAVAAPAPDDVRTVTVPQAWDETRRRCFHTLSQGTRILPMAWFLALEEPSADPIFPGVKLASREYLSRFGFLYDDPPGSLPIGFASETWKEDVDYADPPVAGGTEMVGLTCAACHTGRLDFDLRRNGTLGVRIEGGSAMIDLGGFQEAVGQALFWTSKYRLKSFVSEVQKYEKDAATRAGKSPSAEEWKKGAERIEADLKRYLDAGLASRDYAKEKKLYPLEAGFSRTDALGLIGNRVFGPMNEENQAVVDAPVNFPHLWDAAWFDWVQYNGSIRSPLARNIGEALGVGAAVDLGPDPKSTRTTIRVENLATLEDWLGGDEPFAPEGVRPLHDPGLRPPRWDDVRNAVAKAGGLDDREEDRAMRIDEGLREQGAGLYKIHCARCHLPPREELRKARLEGGDAAKHWEVDPRSGRTFLRLKVVDLDEVGTDPNQVVNFYRRFSGVPTPKLDREPGGGFAGPSPLQTISAAEGLYRITSFLRAKAFGPGALDVLAKDEAAVAKRRRYDRHRTLPRGDADEFDLVLIRDASPPPLPRDRKALHVVFDDSSVRFRYGKDCQPVEKGEADFPARARELEALKAALKAVPPRLLPDPPPALKGEILGLVAPILDLWPEAPLCEPADILGRRAMGDVIRASLGYRARPLDGVWATPPYFHNASVPNLDQVLSPASRRDVKFYLGTRRFDPMKVGYKTEQAYGAFLMDTTLPGNRNTGHEFRNFTLEEFERAMDDGKALVDPDDPPSLRERWDLVLGEDTSVMSTEEIEAAARERTRRILDELRGGPRMFVRNPKFHGVRGVLDPEFTPLQRLQLIEYLKSL